MVLKMFSRRLWSRDFILILLVSAIASYTNGIFMTLLPVYVLDLGGTNSITGMMMTGLTLLGMVTRIIVAPLIDKVGRKKLLVLGSGLYAVNALLFCFTQDLSVLFALRVVHGFTQGIFFPVPPTMVADISPEDMMVDAMGFFGVSSAITFAVTPTIGMAIYNHLGPQIMFISAAVTGAISFVLSILVKEHYQRKPEKKEPAPGGSRPALPINRKFLLLVLTPSLAALFVYIGNSAVMNFLTPCGLSRGLEQISLYFLVNNLAVIGARLTLGRVITVLSKKTCILIGLVLTAAGTALIALAYTIALMLLSAVLMGVGIVAVTQLLQAEILITTPGDGRGVAGTTFMLMSDIGTGIGAALWGGISSGAGYTPTYLLAGLSTLAACVFHGMYWRKKDSQANTNPREPSVAP